MKKENSVFDDARRIALCSVAAVILAINLKSFVHTGGLLPGGFSGLTVLLQNISARAGISLPYGPVYIGLNLFPIVLSFRKIGKKFTLFSCVNIVLASLLADVIPARIITYDVLLISVFGGIINGFATSLCLLAGATTGGTDFISIYASKRFGVDGFSYVLAFNAFLLGIDGFIFGWDKALYSIIFQYVSTQVIHGLYKRYKKDTMFIVTDRPKEIAEAINRLTMHGATVMDAKGSYQGTPRAMIYSVIDSDELAPVLNEVRRIDPAAFVNSVRTDRIAGRFHVRPND